MKNFIFAFFALPMLLFSGCGHTPVRTNTMPMALPPETVTEAEGARRAEEFRKVTAVLSVRGVMVYPHAFIGNFENAAVIRMIKNLGFNRIYCCITSEQELNSELEEFIIAASNAKLPVELMLSQQDFYRAYRGNRLIRWALIQYPNLKDAVKDAVSFANSLPEGVKVAGITVQFTPALINGNNVQRSRTHLYSWNEKNYGIGGDNDMLMREALTMASEIAAIENLPPLTVAVDDFYHKAASEGKLSCGRVNDFAKITPRVAVINSANRPSQLPVNIQNALNSASGNCKILITVPIAGHISMESDGLRRRNWRDFLNSAAYLVKKSASHPACGGIIFSPLAIIEYLRLEK
jgi:hypothetical protein